MTDIDQQPNFEKLSHFHRLLQQHFSLDDIRSLCISLGVNYENLGKEKISTKTRELILLMGRDGSFPKLLEQVKKEKPNVAWPDISNAQLPPGWESSPSDMAVSSKPIVVALGILIIVLIGLFSLSKMIPDAKRPVDPTATPTPVPTPSEDEARIVILPFRVTTADSSDAHNEIYKELNKQIGELGLENVRPVLDPDFDTDNIPQLSNEEVAQAWGKEIYGATILIWGTETKNSVEVNFLNLRPPNFDEDNKVEELEIFNEDASYSQLEEPDSYSRAVAKKLPRRLAFLSLFTIAQTQLDAGKYQKTAELLEEAISLLPSNDLKTGNVEERVISVDPIVDAFFLLGWLYQQPFEDFEDSEKAIEAYSQSINLVSKPNPNLSDEAVDTLAKTYYNRGNLYRVEGDYESALDDFEKASAFRSNYIRAIYAHGLVSFDLKHFETAIDGFSDVIKLDDEYVDAYYARGLAYFERGLIDLNEHDLKLAEYDFKLAEQDFNQANTLAPEREDVLKERARTYNALAWLYADLLDKNYDEAVKLAHKAVEQANRMQDLEKSTKAAWLDTLGWAYYKRGEVDDLQTAKDYLKEALELNPLDDSIRHLDKVNAALAIEMEETDE